MCVCALAGRGWSLAGLAAAQGTAPQVFHACYIRGAGIVYRIKEPGLPQRCHAPAHVEFSWTEGALADGAVTSAKLADGSVTTAKLADGSVTSAKISPFIAVARGFAEVSHDGTLVRRLNVESVVKAGTGVYLVEFGGVGTLVGPVVQVSACFDTQGNPSTGGQMTTASLPLLPSERHTVTVRTGRLSDGRVFDCDFFLVVF